MEYTEYKMDLKRIRAKNRTMKRTLKARQGTTDLVGYGLTVIRARLLEDSACYLTYVWPVLVGHEGHAHSPRVLIRKRSR